MVPNLGAASFLKDPEPLQMELQHSRCAVESESLGGARFHFAHLAVILIVTIGGEKTEPDQDATTKSTPERERFSVPHASRDPKILQDVNLENEDIFELINNPPEEERSESSNNLNFGIRP